MHIAEITKNTERFEFDNLLYLSTISNSKWYGPYAYPDYWNSFGLIEIRFVSITDSGKDSYFTFLSLEYKDDMANKCRKAEVYMGYQGYVQANLFTAKI